MSLKRLSAIYYKYATEFRFIYVGDEKAILLNVVVTNKLYSYLVWMEERQEVEEIKQLIEKSEMVEKLQKEETFLLIKEHIKEV